MKQKVRMLKTLDGVDEGKIYPSTYHAGEEYDIGEDLLGCFVSLGGVELVTDGPTQRETKVTGPEETKPFDITKLNKKDLAAYAKESFGLELDENLKKDDLLAAIAQHAENTAA